MKNKRRIFALFACTALLFSVCACNNGDAGDKGNDDGDNKQMSTEWDGLGSLATPTEHNLRIAVNGSAIAGLENNLVDYTTNNSSVWFSGVGNSSTGEHYAVLDLGDVYNVHKVGLTPYLHTVVEVNGAETQLEELSCFPNDIAVSYCIEEGKYTTAYSLDNYTPVYTVERNENGTKYASDQEFGFDGGYVTARYVKVTFSDMTDDKLGNYLVKLCALKAYVSEASEIDEATRVYEESLLPVPYEGFSITASSVNDADPTAPFKVEALSDGNYGTLWCAEWMNEFSPETDEYIDISTGGNAVAFTQVVIVAHTNNESMPADFDIQYQIDGAGFVTVKSYVDYVNPQGEKNNFNVFTFDEPIIADTIRLQFNKKTPNGGGYYVVLFAEIMAKANVATEEEIAAATAKYQAALGQTSAATETKDDKGLLTGLLIGSIALFVVGVGGFVVPVGKKKEKRQ